VACAFCTGVKFNLASVFCHAIDAPRALDGCDFVGAFILDTIAWKWLHCQQKAVFDRRSDPGVDVECPHLAALSPMA
jgi:hypothetical protein